ncbi:MAG: Ig-like domain-containing protein [Saprospiraceae bacterium]
MKANRTYKALISLATAFIFILLFSCNRDIDELEPATFPTNAEVFIDGFSAGLNYAAFGGSKVTAFDVDTDVKYDGTSAMRFEVPDFEDPEGSYAGGAFYTSVARDLSGYDALTFWAKGSKAATIDVVGFGNDLGEAKYQVTLSGVNINSNWKKYYIPIPDASKLIEERGMFFYSEGPEEGRGYTFWIDEVKFEKLGTIAHPRPAILETQDQTVSAETGDKLQIGGLSTTFNLPSGIDQKVAVAPAYFNFFSSAQSIATVNGAGTVTVLDAGSAVITATLGDLDAAGSLSIESTGAPLLPPVAAPAPKISQDSVISMFSNVYNNVKVDTWNPFWEFSTAEVADVKIGNDDVKRYKNLNFVGILTESEKIDATEMTHFHLDLWTPDATEPPAAFKVLLVDFGADGNFGGGDDSSHELSFTSPTLATETWVSLDIPLADFAGLTSRANIAQLVLSGDLSNVFIDNVYYYNSGEIATTPEPTSAAPTPTKNEANVISLFSDAYTDVPVDTWRTDWSAANFEDVSIAGNPTKKYSNLDFVGIETVANTIDASNMTHFHVDVWSANYAFFGIKLVDFGADGAFGGGDDVEHQVDFQAPAQSNWVGFDIPLSDFAGLTSKSNLAQYILVGQPSGATTVFIDNMYFYNEDGGGMLTEPVQAAPTPAQNAADVISLFSDAYTNVSVDTWRTDWSAANFEDVSIAGNPTKKYSNLDFVGIETVANTIDASSMTHFHVDVWSADYTFFGIKLVDFGADGAFGGGDDVEHQLNFDMPQQGNWLSFDIPLSDFAGLTTKSNLAQYILVGQPSGATTVFIDNMYFYNEDGGGMLTEPVQAAPTPAQNAADVISLFSDAYTNVSVDTWRTDWSAANFEDVSIAGNPTKKYSNLDFVGIETVANTIDATAMTHFHIDIWSADFTLFGIKLVDFGADGAFGGGDDVEHQLNFDMPQQGNWLSLDIPLTDFTGLTTKGNIAQYILVGQPTGATTIYVDNLYFHK